MVKLSVLLLLASLVLTGLGGWMDMIGVERIGCISRRHAWTDGMYVAVLAIAVHLILRM
jgi:hypothetical protein